MRDLSYENEFCMQFQFGFALRLALKQRRKGTRKWPIALVCHIIHVSILLTEPSQSVYSSQSVPRAFDLHSRPRSRFSYTMRPPAR